jgi:RES domain-containing protein
MILTRLGPDAPFYRALTPRWVRAAGYAGIFYRSARDSSQRCLVLYPELADKLTAPVHDPDRRLPRNADSWIDD